MYTLQYIMVGRHPSCPVSDSPLPVPSRFMLRSSEAVFSLGPVLPLQMYFSPPQADSNALLFSASVLLPASPNLGASHLYH